MSSGVVPSVTDSLNFDIQILVRLDDVLKEIVQTWNLVVSSLVKLGLSIPTFERLYFEGSS